MFERWMWALLDIIGMLLLAVGAFGVIGFISVPMLASQVLIAAGIIAIAVSALFIHLDGRELRKEHEEFMRFDEIRKDARLVPNDLDEGYIIDYTAEPSRAISYRNNESEPETVQEDQDGDVPLNYPC
ncbi:MAG: hypothetical protein LBH88_03985 [Candidatus Methanoplasma sp.]|jgi:hypothetical protein|nr:hypothetical protein [Candidatus Methanoplasma sp.]